jgi:hypothetical protein
LDAGARGKDDIGDQKIDLASGILESHDRVLGVARFQYDVPVPHE